MAEIDELKYPAAQNFGNLKGSVVYTSQLGGYSNTRRLLRTGSIQLVDLSALDASIHTSELNGIRHTICTFKNGVSLVAIFFVYDRPNYGNCVDFKLVFNKGSVDYNTVPNDGALLGGSGTSSTAYYTPLNAAKSFGARIFATTSYWYEISIEGSSKANKVEIDIGLPEISIDNPALLQSWVQIGANKLLKVDYDGEQSHIEDHPDFYNYPFASSRVTGKLAFDNFDDLHTPLNAIAPISKSDIITPSRPDDPSQEDDPSGPGGGGGNYDDSSDPIDFPTLPTGGALSSGAIKAFLVTPTLMGQVFNKLWDTSIFDIPLQFQKLVDNPIDCIISFHCLPVAPSHSGTGNIKLGNLDTEVVANIIDNQYLTIDCGSLNIKEYWGSALDYSPYTKCELYMPFVGIKELKIEDVMKSTIHIKYNVDVFTGDCVCNVKCGLSVLYKYAGNLKQDIPVTGRTNNMGLKGIIGIGASFAGGAMGAAMGAPPVLAGVAAGISSAASVASSKIVTTRSGSLSGSAGILDDFTPYLIFHRPVQSLASNFKSFKGYPSNITSYLSQVSGYTEVEYINLQDIPNATSAEMDEIKNLLKQGVLL